MRGPRDLQSERGLLKPTKKIIMAKSTKVKITKPVIGKFGLGYFPEDIATLEEKQAATLIKAGYAVAHDDSDLPQGIPGRKELIKAGITYDELQEITDLENIEGIGKAMAKRISDFIKAD